MYESALKKFPFFLFVGHSLGPLLLIWNVNLVLKNHFHYRHNPSTHLEMNKSYVALPRSQQTFRGTPVSQFEHENKTKIMGHKVVSP
jgi:hypothetical protein